MKYFGGMLMKCPKCGDETGRFGRINNFCMKCHICAKHPEKKPQRRKIAYLGRKIRERGKTQLYGTLVCEKCGDE